MILTDAIFGQLNVAVRKVINTFITGASDVPDKMGLAKDLGISVNDISVFQKTGEDVNAAVNVEYTLIGLTALGKNLKTFKDSEGKCIVLGHPTDGLGFLVNFGQAVEFSFPNATTLHGHASLSYTFVLYNQTFIKLWIPKVINFSGGLDFFKINVSQSPELRIYVNPTLETSNNGGWHPVLNLWKSSGQIMFVRSLTQSFSTPSNSIFSDISFYSIRLNAIKNQGVNDPDQIWVYNSTGELIEKIKDGKRIYNLSPNTSYILKAIIRDSADLYSPQGTVTVTTSDIIGFRSAITGIIDTTQKDPSIQVNKINKTHVYPRTPGQIETLIPGKIETAIYIKSTGLLLQMDNSKSFSFWLYKTALSDNNGYIFDGRSGVYTYMYNVASVGVFSFKVNGIEKAKSGNQIPFGQWVHVYIELNSNVTARFNLFSYNGRENAGAEGYVEQILTFNRGLSQSELDEIINNGDGIQL